MRSNCVRWQVLWVTIGLACRLLIALCVTVVLWACFVIVHVGLPFLYELCIRTLHPASCGARPFALELRHVPCLRRCRRVRVACTGRCVMHRHQCVRNGADAGGGRGRCAWVRKKTKVAQIATNAYQYPSQLEAQSRAHRSEATQRDSEDLRTDVSKLQSAESGLCGACERLDLDAASVQFAG